MSEETKTQRELALNTFRQKKYELIQAGYGYAGETLTDYVRAMMFAFGQKLPKTPQHMDFQTLMLRWNLVKEEFGEFQAHMRMYEQSKIGVKSNPRSPVHATILDSDFHNIVDDCVDIMVVTLGTLLAMGVDPDIVIREVGLSNMSKLGQDGKPILRADGKGLKGPDYFQPDIAGIVGTPKESE